MIFKKGHPGRILAIGAHPDDIEVGAGGLVARLASEGSEVLNVTVSVPTFLEDRLKELHNGAEILGARYKVLVDDRQCRTEDIPMHQLVSQLDKVVAEFRPHLVLTHSEKDIHWDHGLVQRATISALRRWPCNLLAYTSSYEMNAQVQAVGRCFADITDFLETKISAIQAHKSQLPRLNIASSRQLAQTMGRLSGVEYAEGYDVLRIYC